MAGGLLNIVAEGNMNVFLTGNPSKTFFKSVYKKHTNFGLQKFRIDFRGQRSLQLTDDSVFTFKMPRYGDLLMETFMCFKLPHIWSSVNCRCCPYKFKWISNIGATMIRNVRFLTGGQVIQEFSGEYLSAMVERDFGLAKKSLFNKMTGNIPELYDPSFPLKSNHNDFEYPTVLAHTSDPSPSIAGRLLYVPLNIWFTLAAKMAFPIVSTQYAELEIELTLRPINELFTISSSGHELAPNFTQPDQSMKLFLQPPTRHSNPYARPETYQSDQTNWDADLHLISTYAFLGKDEVSQFAEQPQKYLTTQVYQTTFNDVIESSKLRLYSSGMVKNYMWFLRRSDVKVRNQWSNYTNRDYEGAPRIELDSIYVKKDGCTQDVEKCLFSVPTFSPHTRELILSRWYLDLGGKAREESLDQGVLSYVEQYSRSNGVGKTGLYYYNFCLFSSPFDFQPSGGMNMSKFNRIEMGIETITPALANEIGVNVICNGDQKAIGTIKTKSTLYEYTYDLVLFEERYNILTVENGMAGLMYAR